MENSVTIRTATADDYSVLADVMFDAVRNGVSKYSESQRAAWVPQPRSGDEWNARLDAQTIFVAEDQKQVVGFISLAAGGYIDFAYVRPKTQGAGVFRRLYEAIENHAKNEQQQKLWVHASLMAEPAFAAMGFEVVAKENVEIGGESFARFKMEKQLIDN